ncbi:MAG: hypothetical protein QNJ00_16280 [Woeseiaceae bacterium]|nr:hypothetical protein [Woeseiaceae bacterium]
MAKYLVAFLALAALTACSKPDDVLDVADVAVPDQLTGCVARDDDGTCIKAVCVADDEDDCSDWVEACLEHEHIADVRNGHDTCERRTAESD